MNKVYRVIWNATLGLWQCVSELAIAKGKTKNSYLHHSPTKRGGVTSFFILTLLSLSIQSAYAASFDIPDDISYSKVNYAFYSNQQTAYNLFTAAGSVLRMTGTGANKDTLEAAIASKYPGNNVGNLGNSGASRLNGVAWDLRDNSQIDILHLVLGDSNVGGEVSIDRGSSLAVQDKFLLYGSSKVDINGTLQTNTRFSFERDSTAVVNLNQGGTLSIGWNSDNNQTKYNILKAENGSRSSVNLNGGTISFSETRPTSRGYFAVLFQGFTPSSGNSVNLLKDTTISLSQAAIALKDVNIQGNIGANLIKTGAATLMILSNNSYQGDTIIREGVLALGGCGINSDVTSPALCAGDTDGSLAGKIVLNDNTALELRYFGDKTINNTVSGSGNVILYGATQTTASATRNAVRVTTPTTTTIAGSLLHTGSTEIKADNLTIAAGGKIEGTSDVAVNGSSTRNATLTVNGVLNTATPSNGITGKVALNNGSLIVGSGGNVTVHNVEATPSSNSLVQVDNGGTLTTNLVNGDTFLQGFGADKVTLNGTWNVAVADNATVSQQSGANFTGTDTTAIFNKTGNSKLTLTAENNFAGITKVTGGEVDIQSGASITNTASVLVDNNVIYNSENGGNQAKLTVNGTLTTANAGDVEINNGLFTVNGTATVGNIKSTDTTGDKLATVNVAQGGTLTTNLVAGDILFNGFKQSTAKDIITISGTWNADVASGATVEQNAEAAFGGAGTFNKTGAGELDLTADNAFNGAVNVQGGTLSLGNGGDKGDLASETINVSSGANLKVNHSGDYTLDSAVTGAGNLIQAGTGTTTLTKNNTYTGTTTVDNGTLAVAGGASISGTSGVNINHGTLDVKSGGTLNTTGAVNVGDGIDAANTAKFTNAGTASAGSVTVKSDGRLTNTSTANGLTVTGELKVESGTLESSGTTSVGTLTVDKAEGAAQSGTVNITGGTTTANSTTIKDGEVAVSGGKLNGGAVTVGDADGTDEDNAAKLTISGTGGVEATSVTVKNDGNLTNSVTDDNEADDVQKGLKVANELKVEGGTLDTSGTTTAGSLTVDSGAVNVKGGTTSADSTTIKDGEVAVSGGKLNGGAVTVGDADGTDEDNAAKLTISGTGGVEATSVTVKNDGNLTNNVVDNPDTGDVQEGLKVTSELKTEGGTINSSGTTNAGSLIVDSGAVNVKGGTTTVKGDTEIKSGSVAVETAGKLATEGTLKVGDKAGGPGTATLT
ncbi:hypothetical protein QV06_11255, partial [Gallibacterium genomosp. 3]